MIVEVTVLLIIIVAGIFLIGFKAGYKECLQDISEENENPYLATTRKIRTVEEGEYETKFKPGDRVKFHKDIYEAMFGDESEGRVLDYDKDLEMYEVNVIVRNNGRIVATLKNYFFGFEIVKIETEQTEEVSSEN
jgi:hypothetical protein